MKVSILMSTFNANQEYLKLSLDSVFNQDFDDFQLVLVDDCTSEFDVRDFMIENKYDSDKIKYIKNSQNLSLPVSLNRGLQFCDGEYIARMDDDDIMFPNRLSKQYNYMKTHSDYDGCWSYAKNIDKKGNVMDIRNRAIPKNKLKQLIMNGNIFYHPTLFVKKATLEKLNGYNESLKYSQDTDLYVRILMQGNMGFVEEELIYYRRIEENTMKREKRIMTYVYTQVSILNFAYDSSFNLKHSYWIFMRSMRNMFYILLSILRRKRV